MFLLTIRSILKIIRERYSISDHTSTYSTYINELAHIVLILSFLNHNEWLCTD